MKCKTIPNAIHFNLYPLQLDTSKAQKRFATSVININYLTSPANKAPYRPTLVNYDSFGCRDSGNDATKGIKPELIFSFFIEIRKEKMLNKAQI